MKQITDFGVRRFKITGNKIYYTKDTDQYLYSANLEGTNEQKLSDRPLASDVLNSGHVFFKSDGWFGAIMGVHL